MEKKDILDFVKERNVVFIRLQFTDILGIPKNVEIPVAELESALDNGISTFFGIPSISVNCNLMKTTFLSFTKFKISFFSILLTS